MDALAVYFQNTEVEGIIDRLNITQSLWLYAALRERYQVQGGVLPESFAVQIRRQLLTEAADFESRTYVLSLRKALSDAAFPTEVGGPLGAADLAEEEHRICMGGIQGCAHRAQGNPRGWSPRRHNPPLLGLRGECFHGTQLTAA